MKVFASIVGFAVLAVVLGVCVADSQIDQLSSVLQRLNAEEARTTQELAQLAHLNQRLRTSEKTRSRNVVSQADRLRSALRAKLVSRVRDSSNKGGSMYGANEKLNDADRFKMSVRQALRSKAGRAALRQKVGQMAMADLAHLQKTDAKLHQQIVTRLRDTYDPKEGGIGGGLYPEPTQTPGIKPVYAVVDKDELAKKLTDRFENLDPKEGGIGGGKTGTESTSAVSDADKAVLRQKIMQRVRDLAGDKDGGFAMQGQPVNDADKMAVRQKVLQRVSDLAEKDGGIGPGGEKALRDTDVRQKVLQRVSDLAEKDGGIGPGTDVDAMLRDSDFRQKLVDRVSDMYEKDGGIGGGLKPVPDGNGETAPAQEEPTQV